MKACAVVSGAGSGIGKATAEKFLALGYEVILIGRRLEKLKEIENRFPGQALAIRCDVSSAADLRDLDGLLSQKPNIEFLINNAGAYVQKAFMDCQAQDFKTMFEANFFSCVNLSQLIIPYLQKNKKGAIINIASTLGERPVANTSAYSASKAALINLTKSLALELAPSNIRVNCICPGIVDTPIHEFHFAKDETQKKIKAQMQSYQPLGRLGHPEEIAHHILSFCIPGSEWTTGAVLDVDGGIHL